MLAAVLIAGTLPLLLGTMFLVLLALQRSASKMEVRERSEAETVTRQRIEHLRDVVDRIAERVEELQPKIEDDYRGDAAGTEPDHGTVHPLPPEDAEHR